jgi:hypothetical protein
MIAFNRSTITKIQGVGFPEIEIRFVSVGIRDLTIARAIEMVDRQGNLNDSVYILYYLELYPPYTLTLSSHSYSFSHLR